MNVTEENLYNIKNRKDSFIKKISHYGAIELEAFVYSVLMECLLQAGHKVQG